MERYHVYRIFYGDELVYVGRTKQRLIDRMRAHMLHTDKIKINPLKVTLIEYADCNSEADMCLYEVYYINMWHPRLNEDAKASDGLTVELPDLIWHEFYCPELQQWRVKERQKALNRKDKTAANSHYDNLIYSYEERYRSGEIDRKTYEALAKQITVLKEGI